jgi:hypothetical protein
MTEYHAMFTTIASLAFVIAIVSISIMIRSSIVETNLYETEALDEANSLTVSYIVKHCLYGDGDAINEATLVSDPNLCDLCGLCGKGVTARLVDKEDPSKEWSFSNHNSLENEYTSSILVNIGYTSGDKGIGELTVTA